MTIISGMISSVCRRSSSRILNTFGISSSTSYTHPLPCRFLHNKPSNNEWSKPGETGGSRNPSERQSRNFGRRQSRNRSASEDWGEHKGCHVSVMLQDWLDLGFDFEHWRVYTQPLKGTPTKPQIVRFYVNILSQLLGNEEEAMKKIYSVATNRDYYAFGANISQEQAREIGGLPAVIIALPDSYVDSIEKRYPWDPFINGQAQPCDDPRYYPPACVESIPVIEQPIV